MTNKMWRLLSKDTFRYGSNYHLARFSKMRLLANANAIFNLEYKLKDRTQMPAKHFISKVVRGFQHVKKDFSLFNVSVPVENYVQISSTKYQMATEFSGSTWTMDWQNIPQKTLYHDPLPFYGFPSRVPTVYLIHSLKLKYKRVNTMPPTFSVMFQGHQ